MSQKESHPEIRPTWGKIYLFLGLLFILALSLRLIFLLQFRETTFFHSTGVDTLYYLKWAACIRDGVPFINEAYFMGPLYPFFLSLLMRFMENEVYNFTLVQIVIGSLTVCSIAWIGGRVFHVRTGWIAGLMAAFYLPFIFFEGLILMVTLYTFLGIISLFLAWQATQSGKAILFFLSGLLLGLAALARANILAFGFLFVLWLLVSQKKKGIKNILLFGIGVLLLIVPVTVRNYRIEKIFVPITSNAGLNFYIGNNENANGLYVPLDHLPLVMNNNRGFSIDGFNDPTGRRFSELYMEQPLTSSEVSSFWMDHGLQFIRNHPVRFLKNTGLKIAYFWNAYEIPQVENYYYYYIRKLVPFLRLPLLQFMMVAPLAVAGLFLAWRERKKYAVFYIFLLAYFLSIVPFFVTSRYRLPVLPCLILFAAHTLTVLWRHLKSFDKKWRMVHGAVFLYLLFIFPFIVFHAFVIPVVISLVLAVLYFLFMTRPNMLQRITPAVPKIMIALVSITLAVNVPLQSGNFGMAQSINNFGKALAQKGLFEKAIKTFELALSYNPRDPVIHYNLGTTHARLENLDLAERALKQSVEINPSSYSAWLNLSNIYHIRGMTAEDMAVQQKLIQLNPKNYKAYFHLGNILQDQGEYRQAQDYYQQAADLAPEESHIFSNLATVQFRLQAYEKAVMNFQKAVTLLEKFEESARRNFERGGPSAPSDRERQYYKASLFYNLAVVSEKLGRPAEAIRHCREAVRIRPDYTKAHQFLGELETSR